MIPHKIWLYSGGLLVVLAALYLGYNHYQGLLDEVETLNADNATLEAALETQRAATQSLQAAVEEWRESAAEYERRLVELQESETNARAELRRLNDIFSRHDLTRLARARPGLIESRINDGTERVLGLLECETTTPGRCGSDGGGEAGGEIPSPET